MQSRSGLSHKLPLWEQFLKRVKEALKVNHIYYDHGAGHCYMTWRGPLLMLNVVVMSVARFEETNRAISTG